MNKSPLVSVIIPTLNSQNTLEECLKSIKDQTYQKIETIIVDNFSKDKTVAIASKYTKSIFSKGPERSTQRNFGASKAKGEYIVFIDSDMKLSKGVIENCVKQIEKNDQNVGVIIPEESFGEGFWAQCKKLERSFYIGIDWIEAARFFKTDIFRKVKGYDESMISAEDWDLSQRINKLGKLVRIKDLIYHNEGRISLIKTINKKYYYAQKLSSYTAKNKSNENLSKQTGVLTRYKLFFSKPDKLFQNPILGVGMLFMKTSELTFGAVGYLKKGKYVFGS